ncbi:hypothetical protein [Modestobacter sp. SYSU DS0511]
MAEAVIERFPELTLELVSDLLAEPTEPTEPSARHLVGDREPG